MTDPFQTALFGGSPKTATEAASPCIGVTTAAKRANERQPNLSGRAKPSSCAQPSLTRASSGDGSRMTAAKRASTAPSSETKVRTSRQSLSDTLTPSLIASGLVCGITPSSIRQQCGQPIRALSLGAPAGGDAERPKADCSSLSAELQARYAAHRKAYREANGLPSGRMSRGETPTMGEIRPS